MSVSEIIYALKIIFLYRCSVGDLGLIPGLGRFPGEWNGYPLQDSELKNSMDRGAWEATVLEVAKSQTRLNDFDFDFSLYREFSGSVFFFLLLFYLM